MRSFPSAMLSEGDSAARGWLIRVSRNLFIDRYRKQEREKNHQNSHGLEFETIDSVLDAMVVKEALIKLSKEHQEVISHCVLRQLSVADAAQAIGVPPGTVKSRTYYALKALRLQLEEMGFGQWKTTNG